MVWMGDITCLGYCGNTHIFKLQSVGHSTKKKSFYSIEIVVAVAVAVGGFSGVNKWMDRSREITFL